MPKQTETVCALCSINCVMTVTFDDDGNVIDLADAECESGQDFVNDNKEILLAEAK